MTPNAHKLEESLWSHIWICENMESDEIAHVATCLQNCNKGLEDWLRGKITTEDYFDQGYFILNKCLSVLRLKPERRCA